MTVEQLGGKLGSYIPFLPSKLGSKIGKSIGNFATKIFGNGDYVMNKNPLIKNSLIVNNQPMTFNGNQSTIISHREFLGDIVTGTANTFHYKQYFVNPANSLTFPWLSQIASNYESYEMLGLVFEFKSMSANALNSTNTALGQVIISSQFDAGNAPFTDKIAQEQYNNTISFKPSENAVFGVECKPQQNVLSKLYIDNVDIPAGTPIQFTDLCQIQISTNGFQASNINIGEFWVSYHVRLINPKSNRGQSMTYEKSRYTSITPDTIFSSTKVNQIGSQLNSTGAGTPTFLYSELTVKAPPGRYCIITNTTGTGITAPVDSIAIDNGTFIGTWNGTNNVWYNFSTTSCSTSCIIDTYGTQFMLTYYNFQGSPTSTDVFIAKINQDVLSYSNLRTKKLQQIQQESQSVTSNNANKEKESQDIKKLQLQMQTLMRDYKQQDIDSSNESIIRNFRRQ